MKWTLLLPLVLLSCSHMGSRRPAAFEGPTYKFKFQLSSNPIFANGADSTVLGIRIFDEGGQEVSVRSEDLQLLTDTEVSKGKFADVGGMKTISVQPAIKSSNIRFMVIWKEKHLSEIQEIKTTMEPLKEKLTPIKASGTMSQYVGGLYHLRNEAFTPGLYEGFTIENWGTNSMVNPKANPDSRRTYNFEFEEQARQNINFMVVDAPNGTTSHGMYSHFMLFPRKILPYAEVNNKEEVTVTLTTGEKIEFDKEGVMKNDLFLEGPVDTSGDRFKRTYPNIKYQGKGILLRANARGQMPQQGQFESTKIDMEYGIKFSADVLILNGSTGQRCRRPKSDFWPSGDISPIPFKFPTDQEFDSYLKAKCGFGIPDIEIAGDREEESTEGIAQSIWGRCESASGKKNQAKSSLILLPSEYLDAGLKTCLDEELNALGKTQKAKVAFDLFFIMKEARAEEKANLSEFVARDIPARKQELLKDLKWVSDFSLTNIESECLKVAPQASGSLKFHRAQDVLQKPLEAMCASMKDSITPLIEGDLPKIQTKLESDLSWIKGIPSVQKDCGVQAKTLVDSSLTYGSTPKVYDSYLSKICQSVEKSEAYQTWLSENVGALEEKVYMDTLEKLEALALNKAKACLLDYPADTTFNRIRYKGARENCLLESWEDIEASAIQKALIKPVPAENIRTRLGPERRRMQLKVIKENFN